MAKAVLIGTVTPLMLKTAANPGGLPIAVFDKIRADVLADRSQFFKDLTGPFYGANRPGAKVSQGVRDSFWLQGMQAGFKAVIDCIKAFSETDFTDDLKKFDIPTQRIEQTTFTSLECIADALERADSPRGLPHQRRQAAEV